MLAVVWSFCGVGEISSIGINFQKERSGGLERWISMRSSWYNRIQLYGDACKQSMICNRPITVLTRYIVSTFHYYDSYKQNLRINNKPTLALTVEQNPHTAWSGVFRSRALLTWKEKVTASPSTFTASLGQPSRTTPLPPTPNELPPYSATLRPVVVLPA